MIRSRGSSRVGDVLNKFTCFSFCDISSTSFSRSSFFVTSQGPALSPVHQLQSTLPVSASIDAAELSLTHGMIRPPSLYSGLWASAAFCSASILRPVM